MTAHSRLAQPLVDSIRKALTRNALPGETKGLDRDTEREAAIFLAEVAAKRRRGEVALEIQSTGGEAGNRRMRIAIVNDDMPFLVDSIANAIAGRQLTIHRLLHPVVCVTRGADGLLSKVEGLCDDLAVVADGRVLAAVTIDEVRDASTLQQRFLDLVGFTAAGEGSLAWLRSSSD
jgi:glutamate dehydrogenase